MKKIDEKKISAALIVAVVWLLPHCENAPAENSDDGMSTDTTDDNTIIAPDDTGPIHNPDALANKQFQLTIHQNQWIEPELFGEEVGAYVPYFLMELTAVSTDTLQSLLGTTTPDGKTQDRCNEASYLSGSFDNPDFLIGSDVFPIFVEGEPHFPRTRISLYDLTLDAALGDQGETLYSGELRFAMDMREVYMLFYLIGAENADVLCQTLASQEIPCIPCPHDAEPYCLYVKAVDISAKATGGISLEPLSESDLDPSCGEA